MTRFDEHNVWRQKVEEWLATSCIRTEFGLTRTSALYDSWRAWCQERGADNAFIGSHIGLGRCFARMGLTCRRTTGGYHAIQGLRIISPDLPAVLS